MPAWPAAANTAAAHAAACPTTAAVQAMEDGQDFFWLLTHQRDAVRDAKRQRDTADEQAGAAAAPNGQQQEQAPSEQQAEAAPPSGQQQAEAAEPSGPEPEASVTTAAAAVLTALASGTADVPAFLQRRGLAAFCAGTPWEQACGEALLAVLAPPAGPSAAAPSAGAGAAPAAGPSEGRGTGAADAPAAAEEPAANSAGPAAAALAAAVRAAAALHSVPQLARLLLQIGSGHSYVRQDDGLAPLVAAVRGGHVEAACALLDAGAPPDGPARPATPDAPAADRPPSQAGKRKRGGTAGAAQNGQHGGSGGTGSPAPPADQPTPLVLAVVAGSSQLVERLLKAGADANRQCKVVLPGSQAPVALTPLIAAVSAGNAALATRLLAAGAHLHCKCPQPGAGDVEASRQATGGGGWRCLLHCSLHNLLCLQAGPSPTPWCTLGFPCTVAAPSHQLCSAAGWTWSSCWWRLGPAPGAATAAAGRWGGATPRCAR